MLAGAGAATVGLVLDGAEAPGAAAAGRGGGRPSHPRTMRFRSRPDLQPPLVDVTRAGPLVPGYAFVSPAGPIILDHTGSPVWVHPVPAAAANFRVQRYRGEPVLTWWQGTVTKWGTGTGVGVIVDSSYRRIATVRCGNGLAADLHEFLLTDRGTAYLTAVDAVEADLREVGGPADGQLSRSFVQEIDVATGEVLFEWDSATHIPLSESRSVWKPEVNASKPFSAVHLNSVGVMNDGNLLLSARNTWTLYKVDPATGDVLWRLGGGQSDFTSGPGVQFAWQHDATQHRDGTISLFDDEATPPVRRRSRALFLHVDEAAMHVAVTRSYVHEHPRLLAGSQGSVQLLPDGDVFVGWGSEPYFTRFAPNGATLLDGKLATGTSYRAFHDEWTGTPPQPPATAVERTRAGLRLFASWNGATEVARWEALGGPGPVRLRPLAAAPRQGFETAIEVQGTPAWVAARARDAAGRALAVSPARRAPL